MQASIDKVWQAITQPNNLSQWYMPSQDFKAELGAKFLFEDKPQGKWDGKIVGEITRVEEPYVLEHTFVGNQMNYTTKVLWQLRSEGDGTWLTIDHTGFEGFGGVIMGYIIQFGWKKFLQQLAKWVQ